MRVIRLRSPFYRFEDDWGDEHLCLQMPWRGRLWKRRHDFQRVRNAPPYGEKVIDMSPVLLSPDMSQFKDLLSKVMRYGGRGSYPSDWWVDWDLINYEPDLAEAITFVEGRVAHAEAPVIEWIEDELMPRLSA